jgi:hypothetical protein
MEEPVGKRLTGDFVLRLAGVSEVVSTAGAAVSSYYTDNRFFTAKDFGYVPRSVLYDYALNVFLDFVLGDALLQCFQVVGEGDRGRLVLETFEFEFRIEECRVKG